MLHDMEGAVTAQGNGPLPAPSRLAGACRDSLERSRERRAALAARVAAVRSRRRRRGGTASVSTMLAVLALGAPLALGAGSAQAPTPAQRGGLLTVGTVSSQVAAVQRALGVTATGNFGPVTLRAVRAFQRSHGLVVDGIVGPQTRAALGLGGATATASAGSVSAPSGTLARIARCESGGNPRAVGGPGGMYRGKYQFSRATWRAMGGSGDPAAATEAEQDRRAAMLLAQRGTAPWPACG